MGEGEEWIWKELGSGLRVSVITIHSMQIWNPQRMNKSCIKAWWLEDGSERELLLKYEGHNLDLQHQCETLDIAAHICYRSTDELRSQELLGLSTWLEEQASGSVKDCLSAIRQRATEEDSQYPVLVSIERSRGSSSRQASGGRNCSRNLEVQYLLACFP